MLEAYAFGRQPKFILGDRAGNMALYSFVNEYRDAQNSNQSPIHENMQEDDGSDSEQVDSGDEGQTTKKPIFGMGVDAVGATNCITYSNNIWSGRF